ncbi:spindle and kinetochore-associated protein 3 isoform X1 [Meriones unguiculatus]|uniref:spindle and kinetochore-associated protein 3 isoform X1 n=2 Tax=Meriones unguiculatus TaxID=10047 RepID=UPI000B4EB695|nr:spindle and kinetochore-associated protein 3 isoform X1 [Meriones unguiculatus]XP_021494755.1 spindle and kinetochore-associated protein 3 isoform X1 [Meriones unguiculatus]
MNPIQTFHCKLRGLAAVLDGETAQLLRALDGEDGDFEDSPMRILYDLHSEVQTLKDDVNTVLDKARLESQESTSFIKATKVLMRKNTADIIKLREYFQKYGYQTRDKDSAYEQREGKSTPEVAVCEDVEEPGVKGDLSDPCVPSSSVSEKPLRSPQLSDFGLERYMVSQVPANPPQTAISLEEECVSETPPAKEPFVKVLKTPRCAIRMDDFECVTPKLEHFGISEYTMCLNEDYTIGLKNMKNIKSFRESGTSEEACDLSVQTRPVTSNNSFVIPGPIIQQLEKTDAEYTKSPLPPKFCTPGLKIPSTLDSAHLVYKNYPLSKSNTSVSDLDVKDCAPLILNSDECYENFTDPPSPTITSCENIRTPSPPEVTAIPEDILQMLTKHNPNLPSPVEVKAALPRRGFLKFEGQNTRCAANKENW